MIDRTARNQAGLLVRRFANRSITWKEFDDALCDMEFDAQDVAFAALAEAGIWWNKHTTRREMARWVLFLQTDNEYRWPLEETRDGVLFFLTFFAGMMGFLIWDNGYVLAGTSLLVLTTVISTAWAEYNRWRTRRDSDKSARPFFHADELQQAKRFPTLLNGMAGQ